MFAHETRSRDLAGATRPVDRHEPQWRVWFAGLSLFGAAQLDTLGEAQAAPSDAAPPTPWPAAPFVAWVGPPGAYVRREPRTPSTPLSLLHRGDTVTVLACQPDCNAPHAWALLQPRGALPMAALRLPPVSAAGLLSGADAQYLYAKVPVRTRVFARPDVHSRVIHKEKAEFRLAFAPNPDLAKTGWYQRPLGGYMRQKDLKFFTPSSFSGEHELQPPFAFVRRKVKLTPPKGTKALEPVVLQRYDRVKVLGEVQGKVLVPGGSLPRSLVRIVRFHGAPKHVPSANKRIHVDLTEQVLTAYEGNKVVFATLVSTGKDRNKTKSGDFRIYAKTIHSSMRGKPWDDYYAEEIPFVMHFYEGQALHGTYWHDQFGIEKSHGCVNLSFADAKWLFEWVPPQLPPGWHSILPGRGDPQVWVMIEKAHGSRHKPGSELAQDRSAPPALCKVGGPAQAPCPQAPDSKK